MPRSSRQLFGVEHALQQQHRMGKAGFAQLNTLLEPSNGEGIGIRERFGGHHAAMPIGIGFHHGQYARLRGLPAHHSKVMAQRCSLHHRANERGHQ